MLKKYEYLFSVQNDNVNLSGKKTCNSKLRFYRRSYFTSIKFGYFNYEELLPEYTKEPAVNTQIALQ